MAHILTFLKDATFDADATHAMGEAFDMACAELPAGSADLIKQTIARCILSHAQQGERDPDRLSAAALAAVGIAAQRLSV